MSETALPPSYQNDIIESRYAPATSLLSMVPGTPTRVTYYRQYLGRDGEQHDFAPESIETYQSYTRVNNLIVKIDNGNGNYNFDPVNAQSSLSFTGYILFDLAPNKGDVFVKDVGDGRAAMFTIVEQPELRTIAADKVYYFEAVSIATMNATIQFNLDKKVVKELYYSKESAVNGGNAVLTSDDWSSNKRLNQLKFAIMDDILANHYYSDENTITVPNELNDRLYDPYLAKFLSYVMPAQEITPRDRIQTLSVQYWTEGNKMQDPLTVWDMFYRNDFNIPKRYNQKFYIHNRSTLINTRFYGGIFYSKMDRCITVHKDGAQRNPYLYSGALIPSPVPATPNFTPSTGIEVDYFFGDDFFEGNGTEVQQFVWRFFRDKTIDKKGLIDVLERYWDLDDKSKLYMGGIYLVALKYSLVTNSNYT